MKKEKRGEDILHCYNMCWVIVIWTTRAYIILLYYRLHRQKPLWNLFIRSNSNIIIVVSIPHKWFVLKFRLTAIATTKCNTLHTRDMTITFFPKNYILHTFDFHFVIIIIIHFISFDCNIDPIYLLKVRVCLKFTLEAYGAKHVNCRLYT